MATSVIGGKADIGCPLSCDRRPALAPPLANVRDVEPRRDFAHAERPIRWRLTPLRERKDERFCVSGRWMPGKAEMASVEEGFGHYGQAMATLTLCWPRCRVWWWATAICLEFRGGAPLIEGSGGRAGTAACVYGTALVIIPEN